MQRRVISLVLFSVYVNNIPTAFRHIEFAQYTYDTVLVARFKKSTLLFKYLETSLPDLEL